MADKGFDVKVLVPTEDGFAISNNKLLDVRYFLMYNISNRSYQLAGKIKASSYFNEVTFQEDLKRLVSEEKIDYVIAKSDDNMVEFMETDFEEINPFLNFLIDKIDQKKEL